ncbi:AfsR/SARP family transcriptional regulator [Streptomyces sp. 4N509B]|uniref:AfsR/SARP family transcriptional regulator n=1 Tax=Streptomyces sp. 4N509B TaxID=3457413 RepID=UPI003FD630A2
MALECRLLGAIELWGNGAPQPLGRRQEAKVFACLALRVGDEVPVDTLIEQVWDDGPPQATRANLQVAVSRLKRKLGPLKVEHRGDTYVLRADREAVDAHQFVALVDEAQQLHDRGDEDKALFVADQAHPLWRGEPLAGLSGVWPEEKRIWLRCVRRRIIVIESDIGLRRGAFNEVAGELTRLTSDYPDDEALAERRVLALYGDGQTGVALEACERILRRLRARHHRSSARFQGIVAAIRNDVPVENLLPHQGRPSPAVTIGRNPRLTGKVDGKDEKVQRRRFVAHALGVTASVAAGTTEAAAQSPRPTAPVEAMLFTPSAEVAEPTPLNQLVGELRAARGHLRAARYEELGRVLPRLIASAEARRDQLAGRARETAHAMVARAYVLASELATKTRSDMSWQTAGRALTAAEASGRPTVIGEAARVLAIRMRQSGSHREAIDLLESKARSLAEHDDPRSPERAAYASLMLTAAYTAAQTQDRSRALDLAGEATEWARRFAAEAPEGESTVDVTPAQCALYLISIHTRLGTPDEGVPHARQIAPARLPSAERRARYYTDCARMWHRMDDHRRMFAALRAIDEHAPEEARRPSVRDLTSALLAVRPGLPGLWQFAARTGATPA